MCFTKTVAIYYGTVGLHCNGEGLYIADLFHLLTCFKESKSIIINSCVIPQQAQTTIKVIEFEGFNPKNCIYSFWEFPETDDDRWSHSYKCYLPTKGCEMANYFIIIHNTFYLYFSNHILKVSVTLPNGISLCNETFLFSILQTFWCADFSLWWVMRTGCKWLLLAAWGAETIHEDITVLFLPKQRV